MIYGAIILPGDLLRIRINVACEAMPGVSLKTERSIHLAGDRWTLPFALENRKHIIFGKSGMMCFLFSALERDFDVS